MVSAPMTMAGDFNFAATAWAFIPATQAGHRRSGTLDGRRTGSRTGLGITEKR